MDLKFIQDLHQKEFAQREVLAQRASTLIGGITTLGGMLGFASVSFKPGEQSLLLVAFVAFALASGLALSLAAGELILSYRVAPLNDIASPREWLEYWRKLESDVAQGKLDSADQSFNAYLIDQYVEVAEGNIASNFARGTRLVRSTACMLTAFVLTVLVLLLFYVNNYILVARAGDTLVGIQNMLNGEKALACVPVEELLQGRGGGGPKPRPVPSRPIPAPMPPAPGPGSGP